MATNDKWPPIHNLFFFFVAVAVLKGIDSFFLVVSFFTCVPSLFIVLDKSTSESVSLPFADVC